MASRREGSVAPKERINVKFVPAVGDQVDEVELPMKMVVLGDFNGRPDDAPVEERKAVSIDKNSFASVLKDMDLSRTLEVDDQLSDEEQDATIRVQLNFEQLSDFNPDAIARQVPELNKLVELRDALSALKGPLGNMPQFRRALADLVQDPAKREQMLSELGDRSDAE